MYASCHRLIPLPIVSLIAFIFLIIGSRKVLFLQNTLFIKLCIIIAIFVLPLSPYIYNYSFKYYSDKASGDFKRSIQAVNFTQEPIYKNNKIEQIKFSFLINNESKRDDLTIVFGPKKLDNPKAVTQMDCAGKKSFRNGEDAAVSLSARNLTSISCAGSYVFYDFSVNKTAQGSSVKLLPFLYVETQESEPFLSQTYWYEEFNGKYAGFNTSVKNLINTGEVEFSNVNIYPDWESVTNSFK
ncbi:MAG: hypothetical protein Q7K55_06445 [Candidatus Levybacteria bacterium]|nr:hypothetical protein [Candidatus Levybacteria bacterium]